MLIPAYRAVSALEQLSGQNHANDRVVSGQASAMSFGRTEQEERIESIYKELDESFNKASKLKDGAKLQALLKDITNKLKDAKM